jgi:hypothetical protein
MYIYVASSWPNQHQPWIVNVLREKGYQVYDFRNISPESGVFNWEQIDPKWEKWNFAKFKESLSHPLAEAAYLNNSNALKRADVGIMVMPCGSSSHLEIGWLKGMGKHTAIFMLEGCPELMYSSVDLLTGDFIELLDWLQSLLC